AAPAPPPLANTDKPPSVVGLAPAAPPAISSDASGAGAQYPAPDVETLAHNIAQAIEQGGKVMAAYLRPRESGEIKTTIADEVAEMVKSIGRVAEYYLS